jgi:hypothetical protein
MFPFPLQLLITLRKLDCYKLQVEDLRNTGIGSAVATLAQQHPKPDVAQLASRILAKWRDLVETSLFKGVEYDVEAANEAEDGEAVAPEDLIAAEKEQQRLEKLERRRLRIEEDFMAVSSSDDEMSEGPSQDPEWAPTFKKSQPSAPKDPVSLRRSRSGRAAVAERLAKEKEAAEAAAAAAAAANAVEEEVIVESEAISIEANVDEDMKDIVEVIDLAEENNQGETEIVVNSGDGGDGGGVTGADAEIVEKEEPTPPEVMPAAPAAPEAVPNEPETQPTAPAVKKTPKPRLTILAMLQKQAAASQAQAQAQAATS